MIHRGLASLFVALVVVKTSSLFAQAGLQARFDWSVPDRFGQDLRSLGGGPGPDGVRDYWITFQDTWSGVSETVFGGSANINPRSWRVDLDASASTGEIVAYRWSIGGKEATVTATPRLPLDFFAEGKYRVTLTVADAQGNTAETTREVTVQDWLIVALGDSYASGEGNPEPVGQDWFEELVGAQVRLQDATAQLNQALQALRNAELNYDLTYADVQPVLQALNTWNAECPSIFPSCVAATANLIAQLARVGFTQAGEMITKGFQYVRTQVMNLVNVAQAALDVARRGVTTAQALVGGAQEEFDLIFREGATWQTRPDLPHDGASHRSSLSGQALAALALERADPRTSVTFVHLAYSGAQIEGGASDLLSKNSLAQINHLKTLVGEREIDAFLISIGGNDTGFSSIIKSLLFSSGQICDRVGDVVRARCRPILERLGVPAALADLACAQLEARFEALCSEKLGQIPPLQGSHQSLLEQGLARLPERFASLASFLQSAEEFPDLPSRRLYFTEYPNLTEGDDGELCPDFLTVTREDWRWVRDTMTAGLNGTIRGEVRKHGWNFDEGIYEGFHGHGYCANDHWVYHPEESILIQGDFSGMAHPTVEGHRIYGERIAARLLGELYTAGDLSRPRAPGYGPTFRRGNSNGDGRIDISDAIHLLSWRFLGDEAPPCVAATDVNNDVRIDISDAVHLLSFLFMGGLEPDEPFRECGPLQGAGASVFDCAGPTQGCP